MPGPLLRMQAGTPVRVSVRNTLAKAVQLHGLRDRVRGDTAVHGGPAFMAHAPLVLAPGEEREVRFTPTSAVTSFYYGSVVEDTAQPPPPGPDGDDLVGAFVVDPAETPRPADERIFVITIGLGFAFNINGLSWPNTERLQYTAGDSVHWRVINTSSEYHPTSSVRVVSATNQAFTVGLRGSLANLRFAPARKRGQPVGGALAIRIDFGLVNCDTTGGARRVTWAVDSDPPQVAIWQCYRPIMWFDPSWNMRGHATLSGLYSEVGWEGGSSFILCRGESLSIAVPTPSGRAVPLDRREKLDWTPLRMLTPTSSEDKRHFVKWEGDIIGPPASAHLGIESSRFRPVRILEAARWSDRSCPL